jgi:hypothetical protein
MLARFCAVLMCLAIAGCGAEQRIDTAQLPPGFYGLLIDNDIGAINEASWALGSPDRTRGDPVEALRAAVAVEYLAGELNTAPRWSQMSVITRMHMLRARGEFRETLGIKPDAPAQMVVNTLIAAMVDLERGNAAAAQQVLSTPIFVRSPQQTMQVLSNLPNLPTAQAATAWAQSEAFSEG